MIKKHLAFLAAALVLLAGCGSGNARTNRIRAFVKVNDELLRFYWSVGEDIVKKEAEARWGDSVIAVKSQDLLDRLPGTDGFSTTNLGYMKRLYLLYSHPDKYYPQLVGNCEYEKSKELVFYIPWEHHHYLIDKFLDNPKRAFYDVQLTLANNWPRATLLNAIDLDFREPEEKPSLISERHFRFHKGTWRSKSQKILIRSI